MHLYHDKICIYIYINKTKKVKIKWFLKRSTKTKTIVKFQGQ